MENCCICGGGDLEDGSSEFAVLTQKGCDKINEVDSSIGAQPGRKVHTKCRLDLIRPHSYKQDGMPKAKDSSPAVRRRSTSLPFNVQEQCIFCGLPAKYTGKKKGYDVIPVRTMEFQDTVLMICKERTDPWSQVVLGRLEYLRDLHASDAVYHQTCSSNFRTGKDIPAQYSSDTDNGAKRTKVQGRPVDTVRSSAFENIVQYLRDNEEEQLTLKDLSSKMEEYLEGTNEEPYSVAYLKKKLEERFGDEIVISTIKKKANVVTLRKTVASILHEFHLEPKTEDVQVEESRIIETAAILIKSEIRSKESTDEHYPESADMSSVETALEFVPGLLQTFLRIVFAGKDVNLKLASIGQAIVQATRPRAIIAPLQLGLGVQMHHHFSSKFLIDSLNAHGFCSSYSTVQQYQRSAAVAQGTEIPGWIPGRFMQFSADNVDHNSRTLDGTGTFHGMGIIATVTPGTKSTKAIPRREVRSTQIAQTGRIPILHYNGPREDPQKLVYRDLENLKVKDRTANLDLLWKLTLPLLRSPRPGWSGTMQNVCLGAHPGKSSIVFLPMIDMDPGDLTCINSTLTFIAEQASRYGVTPIVTFDQPLWWKALTLIQDEPRGSKLKSIVLRLGGLHMEMSFLGCIGYLMSGSGIEDLLELVYAKNAITHMLSGKAIARAVRGHFLVDAALNALLVCNTFDLPLPVNTVSQNPANENDVQDTVDVELDLNEERASGSDSDTDLELVKVLYGEVIDNQQMAQVRSSTALGSVAKKIEEKKVSLQDHRTGVLWLEYMKMLDILRKFIKGERTGDWKLHLQAVYEMLPYFASAGHNLYAKSAYLYLQHMQALESTHPDVYKSFVDGLHVVRRSDREWAGLSTDLVIEQVM